ncbi:MAG: RNA polymerase subunit sigma [Proteiniphilum sp.]
MKKVETRHTEDRLTTSDPKKMLHKFTARRVLRAWMEDFSDEDTGEIVSIERNEVVLDQGVLIDQNILPELQFYIEAGEIDEVEVSSQRRMARQVDRKHLVPHIAVVMIGGKNKKILLFANSIEVANTILVDFVELNFSDSFIIRSIKDHDAGIILVDNLKKVGEDSGRDEEKDAEERKFYQIDFSSYIEDTHVSSSRAIVQTYNIDRALMLINDHLNKMEVEQGERYRKQGLKYTVKPVTILLDAAKPITITAYVPREFSEAYTPDFTDI